MLSMIVACDRQGGIGYQGWMPWNLPADLKLFQAVTLNKTLIMGNSTYQGLKQPLKKRKIIVLTRQPLLQKAQTDVIFTNDAGQLIKRYQDAPEEVLVAGGAQVYQLFLPACQRLYISHVLKDYPADTYLPPIDFTQFEIIEEQHYPEFIYRVYQKRKG